MSESLPQNPYVGPRSLHYGEPIFGRDREARQLAGLLIAERIVLLFSPSGAGKTSLIEAALIGATETRFQILPVMRVSQEAVGGIRPANRYVFSALLSLERDFASNPIPPGELSTMTFGDYLARREAERTGKKPLLLIFDQFEEILTVDPMKQEEKIEFFNQVGEALRDLKRWALFSMREDYVAALDPYLRPVPTRLKTTFRLDLLSVAGAREAIEEPTRARSVAFTPKATDQLVDDLRQVLVRSGGETKKEPGLYIEPVQLQVVCRRLWAHLPAGTATITEACIAGSSDVDTALADYYADEVRQAAEKAGVKERTIREWCDSQLITDGGLRGQLMQEPGSTHGLGEKAIGLLIDAHLVRREERRGVTWLELAHDRMVKPVRADNAKWIQENLSPFQRHAARWSERGKPNELCLRGPELAEAQAWMEKDPDAISADEREFIAESLEFEKAEAEKARLRKIIWTVASVAVLAVLGLAVDAIWQSQKARRATAEAISARDEAEKERDHADAQSEIASAQSKVAKAQSIAARALQFREGQLDTALLMAVEAHQRGGLPETYGSLLTAAYCNPRLKNFLNAPATNDDLPPPPTAVAFNPEDLLATGDATGAIVLWDKHQRISDRPLFNVTGAVCALAFSADGRHLAACSAGGGLVLREMDGEKVSELSSEIAPEQNFRSLAFSSDSATLAAGAAGGNVAVWNVATRAAVRLSMESKSQVMGVAFDAAGTMLAAGGSDGSIALWSRRGEEWIAVPREFSHGHPREILSNPDWLKRKTADDAAKGVRCLAFSPRGNYLAAGRDSGVVDLYDLSSADGPANAVAFGRHDNAVSGLAFSLKPGTEKEFELMTSSFDGTLRLWKMPDLAQGRKIGAMEQHDLPFTGHVGRVFGVAFSSDRRIVASVGADRNTILWNPWLSVAETVRSEVTSPDASVAFSPDAGWEADGFDDGSVQLVKREKLDPGSWWEDSRWEAKANVKKLQDHPTDSTVAPRVPIVKFSGDGQWLATTTSDGKLRVYNLSVPDSPPFPEIDVTRGNAAKTITAIGIAPTGGTIAAAVKTDGERAEIVAWRAVDGVQLFSVSSDVGDTPLFAVEFSPDGRQIVTAGNGRRAMIWNLDGTVKKRFPEEHTGAIRCVAFSADGKKIVTGSGDNTLILWNAETGVHIAPPLTGHQAPVLTAAFSLDEKRIASGSDDHSVIVWDLATKQQAGRLIAHHDSVRAVAFSRDNTRLYTSSWCGESHAWELDAARLVEICRARANRDLTDDEKRNYIDPDPRPDLAEPVGERVK